MCVDITADFNCTVHTVSLDSRRLGAGDSKNDLFKNFFLNFFFLSLFLLILNQENIINNLLFLLLCTGPVKPTIFPLFLKISAGFRC